MCAIELEKYKWHSTKFLFHTHSILGMDFDKCTLGSNITIECKSFVLPGTSSLSIEKCCPVLHYTLLVMCVFFFKNFV